MREDVCDLSGGANVPQIIDLAVSAHDSSEAVLTNQEHEESHYVGPNQVGDIVEYERLSFLGPIIVHVLSQVVSAAVLVH